MVGLKSGGSSCSLVPRNYKNSILRVGPPCPIERFQVSRDILYLGLTIISSDLLLFVYLIVTCWRWLAIIKKSQWNTIVLPENYWNKRLQKFVTKVLSFNLRLFQRKEENRRCKRQESIEALLEIMDIGKAAEQQK